MCFYERGMASAGKRAGRATTEGLVGFILDGSTGLDRRHRLRDGAGLQERGVPRIRRGGFCERFTPRAGGVGELEQERAELIAKLGENIVVVEPSASKRPTGTSSPGYAHPPANKIGVLVELNAAFGARASARDAHLLRRARMDDT